MEYLDKVLGIKVTYENMEFTHFPNFIATRYRLQAVSMNGQRAIFLYPKTELEQIEVLKKHIARIQKNEKLLRDEILPSAQMLLLHFIYGGAQEMSTSQAAKDLELTPTSISRASKQLEEMGLLRTKKMGVQKLLMTEDSPKALFQKAEGKLLNPIKRTVYIPKEFVGTNLLESGYSALAECSMLNEPNVKCYATEKISQWKDVMTNNLQDSQMQVAVEMWRYNPRKLSTQNIVDELSLALALREDVDERVEEAVEEMLNELWRKIDGYRI